MIQHDPTDLECGRPLPHSAPSDDYDGRVDEEPHPHHTINVAAVQPELSPTDKNNGNNNNNDVTPSNRPPKVITITHDIQDIQNQSHNTINNNEVTNNNETEPVAGASVKEEEKKDDDDEVWNHPTVIPELAASPNSPSTDNPEGPSTSSSDLFLGSNKNNDKEEEVEDCANMPKHGRPLSPAYMARSPQLLEYLGNDDNDDDSEMVGRKLRRTRLSLSASPVMMETRSAAAMNAGAVVHMYSGATAGGTPTTVGSAGSYRGEYTSTMAAVTFVDHPTNFRPVSPAATDVSGRWRDTEAEAAAGPSSDHEGDAVGDDEVGVTGLVDIPFDEDTDRIRQAQQDEDALRRKVAAKLSASERKGGGRRRCLWIVILTLFLVSAAVGVTVYFVLFQEDDSGTSATTSSSSSSLESSTYAPQTNSKSNGSNEGSVAAPSTSTTTTTSSPPLTPSSAVPSDVPSHSPTGGPTAQPSPTSPSSAPTNDVRAVLADFLTVDYGVVFDDIEYNSQSGTTAPAGVSAPNLALDWLAEEMSDLGEDLNLTETVVQRFALLTLDFATNAENGSETNVTGAGNQRELVSLSKRMSHIDDCDWEGIVCDSKGQTIKVQWAYNGLSGTIPSEIRLLSKLQELDLSNNNLKRRIPEQLYSLTALEKLYLFNNSLTGTISTNIGQLDNITHFHLSHNALSGTIPAQLKSDAGSADGIRPLRYFNVYSNRLTGTIPSNLKLRSCIYFDVGRNQLTGTLPEDLGEKFVSLRHLYLDHNNFKGELPLSYNTVGNGRLESFAINHNGLSGVVQGQRDFYNILVQYTLHANKFKSMTVENCYMEVPYGEMVEFKVDCYMCNCDGWFDICGTTCAPSSSSH